MRSSAGMVALAVLASNCATFRDASEVSALTGCPESAIVELEQTRTKRAIDVEATQLKAALTSAAIVVALGLAVFIPPAIGVVDKVGSNGPEYGRVITPGSVTYDACGERVVCVDATSADEDGPIDNVRRLAQTLPTHCSLGGTKMRANAAALEQVRAATPGWLKKSVEAWSICGPVESVHTSSLAWALFACNQTLLCGPTTGDTYRCVYASTGEAAVPPEVPPQPATPSPSPTQVVLPTPVPEQPPPNRPETESPPQHAPEGSSDQGAGRHPLRPRSP